MVTLVLPHFKERYESAVRKTLEKSQRAQQNQHPRGRKATRTSEWRSDVCSLFSLSFNMISLCSDNNILFSIWSLCNKTMPRAPYLLFLLHLQLGADQYASSTSPTSDSVGEEPGQSPPYPHIFLSGQEQECWLSVRRRRYSPLP